MRPKLFTAKGQSSRQKLATDIELFLQETQMSPTPFGLMAARDDKLLWRIKNAKYGISLDKADRIYVFMRTYLKLINSGHAAEYAQERAKTAAAEPLEIDRQPDDHQPLDREQKAQTGRARRGSVRNATAGSPCPAEG